MTGFWLCACYLAVTGILSFVAGRILPKAWFDPECFPYRSFAFEKDGKIYDKLKIRQWQNKVPDMSRIFRRIMPAKNLSGDYAERLPLMLQETCIAELIHSLLCFSGLFCIALWPGTGGRVIALINIVFFNLPFVLIQRYNRPRLMKLYRRLAKDSFPVEKGAANVA